MHLFFLDRKKAVKAGLYLADHLEQVEPKTGPGEVYYVTSKTNATSRDALLYTTGQLLKPVPTDGELPAETKNAIAKNTDYISTVFLQGEELTPVIIERVASLLRKLQEMANLIAPEQKVTF